MAKLNWRYGAMNSGKSDSLIKTAYNYTEQGLRPLVLKPVIDTKSNQVVARAGVTWPVDLDVLTDTDFTAAVEASGPDVVLVDEAQFLTHEQVGALLRIAKCSDVAVIAYGIRNDFRGELFPGAAALFSYADSIEKLPTMCRCGRQAEFNARYVDGVQTFDGDQVAIDGVDATYEAVCGQCWLRAWQEPK